MGGRWRGTATMTEESRWRRTVVTIVSAYNYCTRVREGRKTFLLITGKGGGMDKNGQCGEKEILHTSIIIVRRWGSATVGRSIPIAPGTITRMTITVSIAVPVALFACVINY